MKIAVLSSFTTSLFWFRVDMMQSFRKAGYEVLAVGDGPEEEWAERFADLGIRYRQIPVQRNGTNPLRDLTTFRALYRLLKDNGILVRWFDQASHIFYQQKPRSVHSMRYLVL